MKTETTVFSGFLILGILISLISYLLGEPINSQFVKIGQRHSRALSLIQDIQSKTMEGVEESLAYVLSGNEVEKREFLKWQAIFPDRLKEFAEYTSVMDLHADREKKLTDKLFADQKILIKNAKIMFLEYEREGKATSETIKNYELVIDQLSKNFENLVKFSQEEISETHVLIGKEIHSQKKRIYALGTITLIFCVVFGYFLYVRIKRENFVDIENEKLLNSLSENTTSVIYLKDIHGKYLFINKRFEELFEVKQEKVKGRTDLDIFPSEIAAKFMQNDNKVLEAKTPIEFEELAPHKDGLQAYLSIKTPLFNKSGAIYGICGISTDITERKKKIEEALISKKIFDFMKNTHSLSLTNEDSKRVFETMLDGLLKITEGEYGFIGEVKYLDNGKPYLKTRSITNIAWNRETKALYSQQYEVGMEFYNLDTLFGKVLTSGKLVISNDPGNDSRAGGLPYGHPPLRAFLGIPIRFGGDLIGMVGLANKPGGYDISDPEKVEPFSRSCATFIMAFRENEEKRNVQEQLQVANKNLQLSNQELSSFAGITSHDLMTPIRKISNFCQLIKNENDQLSEPTRTYLEKIQRTAVQASELINDILEYSKLGQNEKRLSKIDLNKTAYQVIDDMEAELKSVEGQVLARSLPSVTGNSIQMIQLFTNLISNSIKYRKDNVPPRIEILQRNIDESWVEIVFKDNGIGFDNTYAKKIFDPFQRLDGDVSIKGSGLGLSICKKIVLAHGGDISAKGKLNEGAQFFIKLPLKNYGLPPKN